MTRVLPALSGDECFDLGEVRRTAPRLFGVLGLGFRVYGLENESPSTKPPKAQKCSIDLI